MTADFQIDYGSHIVYVCSEHMSKRKNSGETMAVYDIPQSNSRPWPPECRDCKAEGSTGDSK